MEKIELMAVGLFDVCVCVRKESHMQIKKKPDSSMSNFIQIQGHLVNVLKLVSF